MMLLKCSNDMAATCLKHALMKSIIDHAVCVCVYERERVCLYGDLDFHAAIMPQSNHLI